MPKHYVIAGGLAVLVLAGLGLAANLGKKERVCRGTPAPVVVTPFTSYSDLKTAQQLTPSVAEQAAEIAAERCGPAISAIATDRIESDLELEIQELEPGAVEAPNRKPFVTKMRNTADKHYAEKLLAPLAKLRATSGSPYLEALAKLADELGAEHYRGATILLVGDGIAVERSPKSNRLVDFRSRHVDKAALDEFVPLLRPLRTTASCVILLGAGAVSHLDDQVLRNARALLSATLAKVGVGFVATRSDNVPNTCAQRGSS